MAKSKLILLCIVFSFLMTLMFCGCRTEPNNPRMEFVHGEVGFKIFKDTETGVYYLERYGSGLCVMVNTDGTPYLGG